MVGDRGGDRDPHRRRFLLAGVLAPFALASVTALAGGAIVAMIAATMIPEAFEQAHLATGLITVLGFLAAFRPQPNWRLKSFVDALTAAREGLGLCQAGIARVSAPKLSVSQRPTTSPSPGDGVFRAGRFAWGLLGVVGGLVAAVIPSFIAQLPALVDSISRSLRDLQPLLNRLPGVPPGANLQDLVQRTVGSGTGAHAVSRAVGITFTALEVLGGLLLLLVALFFYLYEGGRMAGGTISVLPRQYRTTAQELATRIWQTLGGFIRAQSAVATVDAILTGIGLALLGVPLALPLAVLVFLGAFLPYIGAIVTGLLAVLVALASGGPALALAVVALVIVVQQLDGNVIEPLITGRVLQLRPFVVIVAVAVGATLLGMLGAFLAVPVAACIARAFSFLRERQGEGEPEDSTEDSRRQEAALQDGQARQS